MSISSSYQLLTSLRSHEVRELVKQSAIHTVPVAQLVFSVLNLFAEVHPQFCRNNNADNPRGEDFVCTDSNVGSVADRYLERRVTIVGNFDKSRLKPQVTEGLRRRMRKIEKVAADFGLSNVAYAMSLPREPEYMYYRISATGGCLSCISAPMVVFAPAPLEIVVASEASHDQSNDAESPVEQIREFEIAHEMAHIYKSHSLRSEITDLVSGILTNGLWVAGYYSELSPVGMICTYGAIAGASLISRLFYFSQLRREEREADLIAVRYLGSNRSAIAAFQSYEKQSPCVDLGHPPPRERINYVGSYAP